VIVGKQCFAKVMRSMGCLSTQYNKEVQRAICSTSPTRSSRPDRLRRDAGADHDDLCHAGTNDRLCITGTGDRGRDACAASHYDGDTLTILVAFSRDQAWFRTSSGTPH
jgi:hypothetical protein